jgi:hypothetical protein
MNIFISLIKSDKKICTIKKDKKMQLIKRKNKIKWTILSQNNFYSMAKVQHSTYQKKVQHYLLLFLVKNISLHSTQNI